MAEESISWHPGFPSATLRTSRQALALDFEPYRDVLEFTGEIPLTAEPMRIDTVLIKKHQEAVIDNPIAGIFREYTIFEYKSPKDYLSVANFYKGLAYVFAYRSLKGADIQDITFSFVVSRYPREALKEMRRFSGYTVSDGAPGITLISGLDAADVSALFAGDRGAGTRLARQPASGSSKVRWRVFSKNAFDGKLDSVVSKDSTA